MEKTLKPRRLSEVSSKRSKTDQDHLPSFDGALPDGFVDNNQELLRQAAMMYEDLGDFRQRRARAMRYQRGDQWGDKIYDPDTGQYVREDEYIQSQGKIPLKQNLIRSLIKNLQGQYRRNSTKTIVYTRSREDAALGEMMSNAMQTVHDVNAAKQLNIHLMTEAAISGLAVSKDIYDYIDERDQEDIKMGIVSPNRVFWNGDLEDPRHEDIRQIGEMHDLTLAEIVGAFANTPKDEERIKQWYSSDYHRDFITGNRTLSADYQDKMDFYFSGVMGMHRVIEYWFEVAEWRMYVHDYYDGSYKVLNITQKELDQMNEQRIQQMAQAGIPEEEVPLMEGKMKFDRYWYVKFLTPYGHVLYEGETPYAHKRHPYTVFMYPFINGAVWGLVEDIIDQQRYINRTITRQDFIIGAAAKGLLLVHEDSIPKGMHIGDFASEWSKEGGVVKYKGKPGVPAPQQVAANSIPAGLNEMLGNQLKLTYDIMGIHQAMQGQRASAGTPASLYAQEIDQSTTNIKDFMDSFTHFLEKRDMKILKLVQQFYNERRTLNVKGTGYAPEAKTFDPDIIKDAEFDLTLTQGPDTPVYRQIIEDILTNLLTSQLIDLEMYLEHSSMPFADKLLETIKRRQSEAEQNPELMDQIGQAQGQLPQDTNQLMQALHGGQ